MFRMVNVSFLSENCSQGKPVPHPGGLSLLAWGENGCPHGLHVNAGRRGICWIKSLWQKAMTIFSLNIVISYCDIFHPLIYSVSFLSFFLASLVKLAIFRCFDLEGSYKWNCVFWRRSSVITCLSPFFIFKRHTSVWLARGVSCLAGWCQTLCLLFLRDKRLVVFVFLWDISPRPLEPANISFELNLVLFNHELPDLSELFHRGGDCRSPPVQHASAGTYLFLRFHFNHNNVALHQLGPLFFPPTGPGEAKNA